MADVRDAERRRPRRLAALATPTTRIHGQEQRGDGDGDGDDHVVPDAGRSLSRTACARSAGGKHSSERHGRTVERTAVSNSVPVRQDDCKRLVQQEPGTSSSSPVDV